MIALEEAFRILDESLAEVEPAGRIATSQPVPAGCVKVMTGAAVSENAGRVIIVEQAEERGGFVKVHQHEGSPNVCRRTEDMSRGQYTA